jgi:hypothetical protein
MRCEEINEQRKKYHIGSFVRNITRHKKMIYQVFIGNVRCCESVVNDVCEPSIFSLKISVGFVRSLLIFDRRT